MFLNGCTTSSSLVTSLMGDSGRQGSGFQAAVVLICAAGFQHYSKLFVFTNKCGETRGDTTPSGYWPRGETLKMSHSETELELKKAVLKIQAILFLFTMQKQQLVSDSAPLRSPKVASLQLQLSSLHFFI